MLDSHGLSNVCSLFKALTHQTNIKELAVTEADCCVASCHLCRIRKAALEHTAKTTADGQLAHSYAHSCRPPAVGLVCQGL